MITYRPHRGSLSDSMKNKKKFNTLQDLLEYIIEDHNITIPFFQICTKDLSIKMYGDVGDKRVGWKDLFIICYESYDRIADKFGYDRYFNGEHYDHPCGVIGFFTTQPEPCEDAVSRQAVINAVYESAVGRRMLSGHRDLITILQNLPPVQSERKKGEWVITSKFDDCCYAKCNQCNVTQEFYYDKLLTNFCPNCGADMRGEHE